MQKRFFVTALIVVLGFTAVWFYLAEQFEQKVENEIKASLEKNSSIIKFDPDEIVVDKYKFKIHLGAFELLPDFEAMSYSFDKAEISYNPFKNNFTITPGGEKVIFKNSRSSYYIKNPKMSISLNGALFSNNFLDIDSDIEISQKDVDLYDQETDELYKGLGSSKMVISHKRSGDTHIFKMLSEDNDCILHKMPSDMDEAISKIVNVYNENNLEEVKSNLLYILNNIFAGRSSSSIEFSIPDSSLSLLRKEFENFNDVIAGNVTPNPMTLIAVASGDLGIGMEFNTKIGTSNPGKLGISLNKKSGNNFDVDVQTKMHLDEKFNEHYAGIITAIYSGDDIPFTLKKEEVLELLNKHHLGSRSSSMKLSISEDNYKHHLKISCDGKDLELKGSTDEEGMFNESLSIEDLIGGIDYSKLYMDDMLGIVHPKADTPEIEAELNKALITFKKSLGIFVPAAKDLAKLLHKGDELNAGDVFESDMKIAMTRHLEPYPIEINGKSTDDLFDSPEFKSIKQNIEKGFRSLEEQAIESQEASMLEADGNSDEVQ